jgi:hypothetical protein
MNPPHLTPPPPSHCHMSCCRFATALTVISACVVVLCQYDPSSGEAKATNTFYGARLIEVRGCAAPGEGGPLELAQTSR